MDAEPVASAPPRAARQDRLLASDGVPSDAIARVLGRNRLTVRKWRARFADAGVEGLEEASGRGRPPTHSRALVNRVVAATMERPKDGSTHWSARRLGARYGISHSTVLRILSRHGLQPHRSRSFKFSPDPELVEKVTDIVALYLHPPETAVVLCVDEKSQIQALDRTAGSSPVSPTDVQLSSRRVVARRVGRLSTNGAYCFNQE
jgi:putative transposase